jgi:hypothetical protein
VDKSYKEPESDMLRIGSEVADLLGRYRVHCYKNGFPSDLSFFAANLGAVPADIRDDVDKLLGGFSASEFSTIPLNAEWVHIESQPIKDREKIGGFAYNGALTFLGSNKAAWLHRDVAFRLKSDFCYWLDGELHIIDDKTGWGDGDEQQLAIYSYLCKVAFLQLPVNAVNPLHKIVCTFNNIARRTTTSVEFSPTDVNTQRQVLLDAMREINERKEWPAVACQKCQWCTVPGCPIREEASTALVQATNSPVARVPSEITWLQDAEKALIFVEFAEGIVGQVKELLKAWVAKNGPVSVAGKVARFQDKESWKTKDLAGLCAALVSFGAPKELVWKELSLTKTSLEKIVKKAKLEAKQPWIDAYLEKSASKAFGIMNDKTY